jgi:L-threonylcarbamoyladenylate synthase
MARIVLANFQSIDEAASLLRGGDIVVLPTETVYGLGANALDDTAVAKIFEAKNRPSFNPLIVHVSSPQAAAEYVEVTPLAKKIMDVFWPGPLTLVLNQLPGNGISRLVSAGLPTLAVRMPAHPVMLDLLKRADLPVAAPSANAAGEPSATTPRHAADSLGGRVDFILGAGACDIGLESTVLDLSGAVPTILRPGAVTAEDLAPYLDTLGTDESTPDRPKSPGQILKHYAPALPVRLNAVDVANGEALLAFGSIKFMGVKGGGHAKDLPAHAFRNLSESGDLDEAAKNLFTMLRDLDDPANNGIAVMAVPVKGIGVAINDRLRRAAEK